MNFSTVALGKLSKLKSMVEVFRTNVSHEKQADFLLEYFHKEFPNHKINFDLEDCDNILRVETDTPSMDVNGIMECMKVFGFKVEVLSDEPNILKDTENLKMNRANEKFKAGSN